MKTAEVDTVLQREDIGLVVQLKSQLFELLPNESQRLAGCLHVRADHIPVVHIHPGQRQMQLFADIVHDGVDIEHSVDVAGLVSQGQSLVYLVYVLPHKRLEALVRETLGQHGLEPVMVDALEEMPDVALDNCAVGVVPLLLWPVRETGGGPRRLVCALPLEKMRPHVLFQHIEAEVDPFADLGRIGVQRQTAG